MHVEIFHNTFFEQPVTRDVPKKRPNQIQTDPTESKPIQTKPKYMFNQVQDFINLNGSVWFDFKPNQTKKSKYFFFN